MYVIAGVNAPPPAAAASSPFPEVFLLPVDVELVAGCGDGLQPWDVVHGEQRDPYSVCREGRGEGRTKGA